MELTWLSLLPPVVVVISALITQRLNPSLFLGAVSACVVGANFCLSKAATLLVKHGWSTLRDLDNLYLFAYLFIIGVLITLLNCTGAATAFAKKASERIKNAKGAQKFSLLLSGLLSIDDYLSILTVGYVMRSLTDRFGISRLKLAFLVHSIATPLIILAPYSSWVPVVTGSIDNPNYISTDSLLTYLMSVPFIFYSFCALGSVWFIINRKISYGPMCRHEKDAHEADTAAEPPTPPNSSIFDLVLPLGILVGGLFVGIPFAGGYHLFGGTKSLIQSLQQNDYALLVMFISVTLAFAVATISAVLKGKISPKKVPNVVYTGLEMMRPAVVMVFLAFVLSDLLRNVVMTGEYLAHMLLGSVPLYLLPVMFFFTALINTLAIGSAWATFGILPPIAIPMTLGLLQVATPATIEAAPLLLPVIGAIFAGAICGNHLSPFSETTMLTATSTDTTPWAHAYTQLFYMLPAVLGSIVSFVLAGILISWSPLLNAALSLVVGLSISIALLLLFNRSCPSTS